MKLHYIAALHRGAAPNAARRDGASRSQHHGSVQRPSEGGGPTTTMKTNSVSNTAMPPPSANLRAQSAGAPSRRRPAAATQSSRLVPGSFPAVSVSLARARKKKFGVRYRPPPRKSCAFQNTAYQANCGVCLTRRGGGPRVRGEAAALNAAAGAGARDRQCDSGGARRGCREPHGGSNERAAKFERGGRAASIRVRVRVLPQGGATGRAGGRPAGFFSVEPRSREGQGARWAAPDVEHALLASPHVVVRRRKADLGAPATHRRAARRSLEQVARIARCRRGEASRARGGP